MFSPSSSASTTLYITPHATVLAFLSHSKKKKDPNAPKKPKSAYFVFAETRRDALRAQYPEDRVSDTAKRTGEEWRGMTEEQKRPFQLKAQELKQEYDQAVAEYKASLE